jgi:hypothetical protein
MQEELDIWVVITLSIAWVVLAIALMDYFFPNCFTTGQISEEEARSFFGVD